MVPKVGREVLLADHFADGLSTSISLPDLGRGHALLHHQTDSRNPGISFLIFALNLRDA